MLTLGSALAFALAGPVGLIANDDPDVAVAVTLSGQGAKGAAGPLQEAVRAGLDRGGTSVSSTTLAPASATCDDACWTRLGADAGVSHVVVANVTVTGRDYEFELRLIDTASGRKIASNRDRCEICGIDEVAELVSSKAAALGDQLASLDAEPPVLVVESDPSGARVVVDGEAVGKTPFEGQLSPGTHVVRVEKAGHVSVEREMVLDAGITSNARFSLERTGEERAVSRRIRPVGWGLLGGGVALLGGGVALLAIDDREAEGRCSGDNVDADGDCKFLINTMWGGASLAVLGGAALASGVAILILTRAERLGGNERARLVPAVSPMSVGLAGRF